MTKNYLSKPILILYFTIALIAATFSKGLSQNILIYAPSGYTPIAKNIAPGSVNNYMAMFVVSLTSGTSATLTSVSFPTAGNFTASDISANGFKLWHSNSLYTSSNPIQYATEVASTGAVANGSNIVFTGLSKIITGGVFYLSADIAPGAVIGNTVQIGAVPLSNIVFSSGSKSGSTIPAMSVQTIGTPLPIITLDDTYVGTMNVSAGSSDVKLYGISMNVEDADAVLNSITIPTKGIYFMSDWETVKLWRNTSTGGKVLLKSVAVPVSGGNIVLSGLNQTFEKNSYHYLTVTADVPSTATSGHSFGIESFPRTNIVFSQSQVISGPTTQLPTGPLHTIATPSVKIGSAYVSKGEIAPGSFSNILYKLKIDSEHSGAAINQISFTTGGSYKVTDIANNGFKIFRGELYGYYQNEMIESVDAVVSGGTITFDLPGYVIQESEESYIYLVVDIAPTAANGSTIFIKPLNDSNLEIASGIVTGTGRAGGMQTIVTPTINFTAAGPIANTVAAGTNVQLHTVKVNVSGAPITFNSASFSTSGTFQISDFDVDEKVYLMYHKTPNLIEEWKEYNSVFIISESSMPASGGVLTFNYMPFNDWEGINPAIPVGSGYISVMTRLSKDAVVGHNIQLNSSGIANYTFGSGAKTGTTGSGGVQTIGTPDIFISNISTPVTNISPGTRAVLYKTQLDVSTASAMLKKATFITDGTYNSSDIYNFSLYSSSDLTFDDNDYYLGYVSNVVSGGTMEFSYLNQLEITAGSPTYLFLVASTSHYATLGKTISITSTPATNFNFVSGTPSGGTLPAGGVHTFTSPATIDLTFPLVSSSQIMAGSEDTPIYSFTVTPKGSSAILNAISLPTSGSFISSDLNEFEGFRLYYNNINSFEGSRQIGYNEDQINFGEALNFNYLNFEIKDGATGYFFVTTNISGSATASHTIKIEAVDASAFTFITGTPSGTGIAGNSFVIKVPVASLITPVVSGAQLNQGSKDNVIYRFNITPESSITPTNITLSTGGNFVAEDIEEFGFKLYYNNSNSFAGSKEVSNVYTAKSGEILDFEIFEELIINEGSTGYFFITADISWTASSLNTLQIEAIDPTKVVLNAGAVSGTGLTGATFEFKVTTGLFSNSINEGAKVYPNPTKANSYISIECSNTNSKLINIYSSIGSLMKTTELKDGGLFIDNLERGTYILVIQDLQTNQKVSKRLVIE